METETEEGGVPENSQVDDFHILDMDFFDDESLVIVCQKIGKEGMSIAVFNLYVYSALAYVPEEDHIDRDRPLGPEMIGTVDYSGLEYSEIGLDKSGERLCVEDIVAEAITQVTAGEVSVVKREGHAAITLCLVPVSD